ncbi:hypothetical protein ACOSQ3_030707 [Xanthoceras sorbifolium]
MEHPSSSFTILLTFLVFVFMVMKLRKTSKTSHQLTSNLPPGPWKLPLIGNMHLLVGCLPHHCLTDLAKKFGPLMHLQLGEISHVVISSPETARQVMKIHDISFADRPRLVVGTLYDFKDIAFAPYGDYWRQLRKICTLELLSAKRVQSCRYIREEEASNLIRSTSSNAGSAAFGGRCKDQEAFIVVAKKIIELAAGFGLAVGLRSELEKHRQEEDKILDNIINEHRACKATGKAGGDEDQDLLHVLLNLMEAGDLEVPLTTDNIKAVILDLFIAGSETSSTTVEWAISEMLKNPRVLEKAQAEVRQVFDRKRNVDEASLHELEYLKIIVNAWAIGRDPNYWTEAESFYPERFLGSSIDYKGANFELIPFGAGRRICPGISFGIANVELPLAHLLYHFDWKLPNEMKNEDLDMTESFGATVRRKNDLYLIPIPPSK